MTTTAPIFSDNRVLATSPMVALVPTVTTGVLMMSRICMFSYQDWRCPWVELNDRLWAIPREALGSRPLILEGRVPLRFGFHGNARVDVQIRSFGPWKMDLFQSR